MAYPTREGLWPAPDPNELIESASAPVRDLADSAMEPPRSSFMQQWRVLAFSATAIFVVLPATVGALLTAVYVAFEGHQLLQQAGQRAYHDSVQQWQNTQRQQIDVVLTELQAAVQAQDREAFTAFIAADASPSTRDLLGREFDFYTQAPAVAQWDATEVEGDQTRSSKDQYFAKVSLDHAYQIEGFDVAPVTTPLTWTMRRTPDRSWQIVEDVNRAQPALTRPLAPWLSGDFRLLRAEESLVIADLDAVEHGQSMADKVSRMVLEARRQIPALASERPVVMYLNSDADAFWSELGYANAGDVPDGMDPNAGFVLPLEDAEGKYAGHRLMISPYSFRRESAVGTTLVLRHEVTHAVTHDKDFGTNIPSWMIEGLAMYRGSRGGKEDAIQASRELNSIGLSTRHWQEFRSGSFDFHLESDPNRFYRGTDQRDDNYVSAWMAFLYLADTHGEDKMQEMYDRAREMGGVSRGEQLKAQDEILQDLFSLTKEQLEAKAKQYAMKARLVFV